MSAATRRRALGAIAAAGAATAIHATAEAAVDPHLEWEARWFDLRDACRRPRRGQRRGGAVVGGRAPDCPDVGCNAGRCNGSASVGVLQPRRGGFALLR